MLGKLACEQSLESLRTKSKLNVCLGVRTAYASHELTAWFCFFCGECSRRVWQYNSLCWSFSTDNTHPEGGHTSYYGLKGQKERRMREQPSHVPISSSSPVSGTPSRLPPAQRKNRHVKQKQQTVLKVQQPYVCNLHFMDQAGRTFHFHCSPFLMSPLCCCVGLTKLLCCVTMFNSFYGY